MRVLTRVAGSQPLAGILDHGNADPHFGHRLADASDEELVEYIRTSTETLYHPTCTARMSPLSQGGVVDARLRVHGIPNLRVVDASVFPTIIAGHTVSTPEYMRHPHFFGFFFFLFFGSSPSSPSSPAPSSFSQSAIVIFSEPSSALILSEPCSRYS